MGQAPALGYTGTIQRLPVTARITPPPPRFVRHGALRGSALLILAAVLLPLALLPLGRLVPTLGTEAGALAPGRRRRDGDRRLPGQGSGAFARGLDRPRPPRRRLVRRAAAGRHPLRRSLGRMANCSPAPSAMPPPARPPSSPRNTRWRAGRCGCWRFASRRHRRPGCCRSAPPCWPCSPSPCSPIGGSGGRMPPPSRTNGVRRCAPPPWPRARRNSASPSPPPSSAAGPGTRRRIASPGMRRPPRSSAGAPPARSAWRRCGIASIRPTGGCWTP